jgi:carboxypeptidase Q
VSASRLAAHAAASEPVTKVGRRVTSGIVARSPAADLTIRIETNARACSPRGAPARRQSAAAAPRVELSMKRIVTAALAGLVVLGGAAPLPAQTFPTENDVLRRIWTLGMDESHAPRLAQALLDSIGPRLTGTPQMSAANDWAVAVLRGWGVDARNEQYGTWRGWRRGHTHIDLVAPRQRTLEGTMLAWSPGTPRGRAVEGPVILLPEVASAAEFDAWLPQAKGRFVAISFAEPTCRPNRQWQEFATPESFERMQQERDAARAAWSGRLSGIMLMNQVRQRLDEAGAAGILQSYWSNDFGVNKVFSTNTTNIPTVDLSCEDYGLVFRLAQNGQGPVLRLSAQSEALGEVPVYNTLGMIRGSERPDEYVILSAHFDSWDSSSGATDNGTGSVTMLEAMRILKAAYPNPNRTILLALWGGEEQGLNGSRAFVEDNPKIVAGVQALFNQDNGTGRVVSISMQGYTDAAGHFGRWLARVPTEITQHIDLNIPGTPGGGGTDHASFVCAGAAAFNLSALNWGYGTYTWHTNRDTYDKIVFDDLRNNATLVAMLAYLASEDPERVSTARRVMPTSPQGRRQMNWPTCQQPQRSSP